MIYVQIILALLSIGCAVVAVLRHRKTIEQNNGLRRKMLDEFVREQANAFYHSERARNAFRKAEKLEQEVRRLSNLRACRK